MQTTVMQAKPAVEGFLEQVQSARSAWPQLAVDPDKFAQHLAHHLQRREAVPNSASLHAADLYLAFACARGEPRALAAFEQRHLSRVGSSIAHLRPAQAVVDEVRQRLRERLLVGGRNLRPKLLDYSGRGALSGWVRVTAIREALDLLESEKAHQPAEQPEDDLLAAAVDPELVAIHRRYQPQLREAFHGALRTLDVQERNLMRFFLVDGLNIGRIGRLIGKSRATVGRMVVDCRAKLLDNTRERFSQLTGAQEGDLASLIRFLRSQLDVSIRGFLMRETPPS